MILSTNKWSEYRNYTINRLLKSSVNYDPYWHVIVNETLHPELFHLCKINWPKVEDNLHNKNVPGHNQHRDIWNPDREELPFWREYYNNIICHSNIIDTIYNFEGIDRKNYAYSTSSLWSDYKGYSVNNHYDAYTIDVAWQTYVYCSGGEQWGTSMNDAEGNELKRFPFLPNTCWLMRVDSNSWHSCDEIDCTLRQSIMARLMTTNKG